MLRKILLSLLLLTGVSYGAQNGPVISTVYTPAPERREFRIAHDSWTGQDKYVDHGFGSFAVAYIVASVTHAQSPSAKGRVFYWCAGFWTANEVKDAFAPWEKVGWVGGDGFSYKDLVWSLAGTGLALIVHKRR